MLLISFIKYIDASNIGVVSHLERSGLMLL